MDTFLDVNVTSLKFHFAYFFFQMDAYDVNIYSLVHPGKTSVPNFFSLDRGHCGYDGRSVYSTSQLRDK